MFRFILSKLFQTGADIWIACEAALPAHEGLKRRGIGCRAQRRRTSRSGKRYGTEATAQPLQEHTAGHELKLVLHVITHLVWKPPKSRIVFTPNQISLETESGKFLDTRIDPRSAFAYESYRPIPNGTNYVPGMFCSYARSGGYLTTPFHLHLLASRFRRLSLGMRTESVGACCRFAFLTDTRRIRSRNIPTSARTAFSGGHLCTVDVFERAGLGAQCTCLRVSRHAIRRNTRDPAAGCCLRRCPPKGARANTRVH